MEFRLLFVELFKVPVCPGHCARNASFLNGPNNSMACRCEHSEWFRFTCDCRRIRTSAKRQATNKDQQPKWTTMAWRMVEKTLLHSKRCNTHTIAEPNLRRTIRVDEDAHCIWRLTSSVFFRAIIYRRVEKWRALRFMSEQTFRGRSTRPFIRGSALKVMLLVACLCFACCFAPLIEIESFARPADQDHCWSIKVDDKAMPSIVSMTQIVSKPLCWKIQKSPDVAGTSTEGPDGVWTSQ